MKIPNMRPVNHQELPDQRHRLKDALQALVGSALLLWLCVLEPSWWMQLVALSLAALVHVAIDKLMTRREQGGAP